jgi:hypothetical protein
MEDLLVVAHEWGVLRRSWTGWMVTGRNVLEQTPTLSG